MWVTDALMDKLDAWRRVWCPSDLAPSLWWSWYRGSFWGCHLTFFAALCFKPIFILGEGLERFSHSPFASCPWFWTLREKVFSSPFYSITFANVIVFSNLDWESSSGWAACCCLWCVLLSSNGSDNSIKDVCSQPEICKSVPLSSTPVWGHWQGHCQPLTFISLNPGSSLRQVQAPSKRLCDAQSKETLCSETSWHFCNMGNKSQNFQSAWRCSIG